MTVTLNKKEVLNRAYRFMKEFADADYEMGQAQDFIDTPRPAMMLVP